MCGTYVSNMKIFLLFLLVGVTHPPCAVAQDFDYTNPDPEDVHEEGKKGDEKKKRDGDFIYAPIPMSNPTYGTGLAVGAVYLYDLDAGSQASLTGVAVFKTSNGRQGAGFLQRANFGNNRFKAKLALSTVRLNYDYFGIGNDAGDRGNVVPVSENKEGFLAEFSTRLFDNISLGPQYKIARSKTRIRTEDIGEPITEESDVPPSSETDVDVASLGAILRYDTRDNSFYPRNGWLVEFEFTFNDPKFGSDFTFNTFKSKINYYHTIASNQTIAARASYCSVNGDTPFFELCLFGKKNDLRGYPSGQYRDRKLFTVQTEYRWQAFKKFGFAAFVGAGGVAKHIRNLDSDDILPSYGIGIRYMVSEKFKINLSVDYARGKDNDEIYLRVGESF